MQSTQLLNIYLKLEILHIESKGEKTRMNEADRLRYTYIRPQIESRDAGLPSGLKDPKMPPSTPFTSTKTRCVLLVWDISNHRSFYLFYKLEVTSIML